MQLDCVFVVLYAKISHRKFVYGRHRRRRRHRRRHRLRCRRHRRSRRTGSSRRMMPMPLSL